MTTTKTKEYHFKTFKKWPLWLKSLVADFDLDKESIEVIVLTPVENTQNENTSLSPYTGEFVLTVRARMIPSNP